MYMLRIYYTCTDNSFCQGYDSAPGLDIMLLKQQHFSVSGHAADPARQHPPVEYVYRRSHPLLQFLPRKLETQPQLFHISTAADSGTLLSAAVPMVRALPRGGAAMFTRSTPGCGTLDGPSLAWAASQWPRLRRSEGNPGPRLPNERGQQSGPGLSSNWYIHGIYMVYTWYIHGIYHVYPGCE